MDSLSDLPRISGRGYVDEGTCSTGGTTETGGEEMREIVCGITAGKEVMGSFLVNLLISGTRRRAAGRTSDEEDSILSHH